MNFIGADLHKQSITLCVMDEELKVLPRKAVPCDQPDQSAEFFRQSRPFKVVVDATASYLLFVALLEPRLSVPRREPRSPILFASTIHIRPLLHPPDCQRSESTLLH
jgi:hypothetical protein